MENSATSLTLLDSLRDPSDEGAWRRFDSRYRPLVVEFARRLGTPDAEAEEAAQRTMAGAWQACQRGQYERGRGRVKNWLLGVARHKIADLFAERARQPLSPSQRSSVEAVLACVRDPESVSSAWERQWAEHVLRRCFRRVRSAFTPRDVGIFERLTVAQKSAEDVAAAMDVPIKTVYNVKHRVLTYMRQVYLELDETV